MNIICDTDFLSSILKIKKLNLILKFFEVNHVLAPTEVINEMSQTILLNQAVSKQIKSVRVNITVQETNLGKGELAAISLALEEKNAILLSNDKKAIEFAKRKNVKTLDLFAFLLVCKKQKFLTNEEIKQIIEDLRKKDYFEFGNQREKILLNSKDK